MEQEPAHGNDVPGTSPTDPTARASKRERTMSGKIRTFHAVIACCGISALSAGLANPAQAQLLGIDLGLGGDSIADASLGIGGDDGLGVDAEVGGDSLLSATVSAGGSGGDNGNGNGDNGNGTSPGSGVTLGPVDERDLRRARRANCAGMGNSEVYNGFIAYDRSGSPMGVVHDTLIDASLTPIQIRLATFPSVLGTVTCVTTSAEGLQIGNGALLFPYSVSSIQAAAARN